MPLPSQLPYILECASLWAEKKGGCKMLLGRGSVLFVEKKLSKINVPAATKQVKPKINKIKLELILRTTYNG